MTLSFAVFLFTVTTAAQEMSQQHHHEATVCHLCCCSKEMSKCNHLCHRMPDNYQVSVEAPSAIVNDATTKDWFNTFLETMNKESGKSALWSNEACIEMCSVVKKQNRKNVRKSRSKRHHISGKTRKHH